MRKLEYLIEKIIEAKPRKTPYKHFIIENYLEQKELEEILADTRTNTEECIDDGALCRELEKKGYQPSWLPGSTDNVEDYLASRTEKKEISMNTTCKSKGMAFALKRKSGGSALDEVINYMRCDKYWETIYDKCNINKNDKQRYVAYTKYLDGHEISPHTDSRHKPVTFLLNLNHKNLKIPNESNTRIMKLKKEYRYIAEYWKYNKNVDRCWLPWECCETINIHSKNNSLLIIPASNISFHAIKLDYNHLKSQRSMIYGSAWGKSERFYECPTWEDLEIKPSCTRRIKADNCKQERIT